MYIQYNLIFKDMTQTHKFSKIDFKCTYNCNLQCIIAQNRKQNFCKKALLLVRRTKGLNASQYVHCLQKFFTWQFLYGVKKPAGEGRVPLFLIPFSLRMPIFDKNFHFFLHFCETFHSSCGGRFCCRLAYYVVTRA